MGVIMSIIIAHGKEDEQHDEVLDDDDELVVGEGDFPVKEIGTEAGQRADISRHRRDDIATLIDPRGELLLQAQDQDEYERKDIIKKGKERQQ